MKWKSAGDRRITYGMKDKFLKQISITASRINSQNSSILWESQRNVDYIYSFLKRKQAVEGSSDPELVKWIHYFEKYRKEAALSFWHEMHKGIKESLRGF